MLRNLSGCLGVQGERFGSRGVIDQVHSEGFSSDVKINTKISNN